VKVGATNIRREVLMFPLKKGKEGKALEGKKKT